MKTVRLLLLPKFQMLAAVLAMETLRIANKRAGENRFQWHVVTADDRPACASNGAAMMPDIALQQAGDSIPDLVLVIAGYDPLAGLSRSASGHLRKLARQSVTLGGLDTGSMVLAELGLLSSYRAVLHYEAEPGFRETWPEIDLSDAIYCLDRDRLTAAGGLSTADAMLAWITQVETEALAKAVAEDMVHGPIRAMDVRQRPVRAGLEPVIESMKTNLESPVSLAALAQRQGVSIKVLTARFRRAYGVTPGAFYQTLRLDHARDLLGATDLTVAEVAAACGFNSLAWFTKAYARRFGVTPGRDR